MTDKWLIARDQKKFGPYSTDQLAKAAKDGKIKPTDMVQREGETVWKAASTVDAFFPQQKPSPPPLPPQLPPPLPSETSEWHYAQNGGQFGPITWSELRTLAVGNKLATSDMVWKPGMANWMNAASIDGLFELPPTTFSVVKPPPVPAPMTLSSDDRVSFELTMDASTEASHSDVGLQVQIDGEQIGEGSSCLGTRLNHLTTIGNHILTFSPKAPDGAIGLPFISKGMLSEGAKKMGVNIPVVFDQPGHYSVIARHTPDSLSNLKNIVLRTFQGKFGLNIEVLSVKRLDTVPRKTTTNRSAAEKAKLPGLWEPVSFEGDWFMFTSDKAMLRADGIGTRYRWVGDDTIELFADDTEATTRYSVLSISDHELILRSQKRLINEPDSLHWRKSVSISDVEIQKREEEARRRRAEAVDRFKKLAIGTASILAAGGFAVLCCGVAVAAASGPSQCRCPFPIRRSDNFCDGCGLHL